MTRHSYVAATSLLLISTVLTMAGCGGGGASNTAVIAGSCNTPANGFCVEYGAGYKELTLDRLCKSQKGEHSTGACPVEGRAGSCLVKKGEKSASTYRYYAGFPGYGVTPPKGVAAAAKEQCVNSIKGEWSAG